MIRKSLLEFSLRHTCRRENLPRYLISRSCHTCLTISPPEVKARMSAMELSKWRAKQRRLRKAETQRNNRLRKKELLKSIKEELPELKSKVEEINKDAQILCEIKGIILVAKEDLAATQVEKSQDSESTAKETIVKVDTPADSSSTAIAKTDDHFIKTSTHVDIYQDFKPAASAKTVDDDMYADVHEDPSQAFNFITNAKAEDCTKTQDPTSSNPIPLADDDFSIADDLDLGIDEDLFQDGSNGITIPDPNLEQYEMAITEEFDMDKVFD